MSQPLAISHVSGRGLPIRGNDTDRIMPARFLVSVSFEGLERHLFEDDRKADPSHPSTMRYRGASVLVVNANFGCGSSREHAPQGPSRSGPCRRRRVVRKSSRESQRLTFCFAADPHAVDQLTLSSRRSGHHQRRHPVRRDHRRAAPIHRGASPALRDAFVSASGTNRDAADRFEEVKAVAASLHIKGF